MNIKYLVVSAPISQPLSQPGRRSTIPHDTTVGASEAGVLDHPEVRRCWSAAPSTPPNAPVQKARTVNAWKRSALYHLRSRRGGGRRHALLRERASPGFTRTAQASPRVGVVMRAFIGAGRLVSAAGLRHDQHLLLCGR